MWQILYSYSAESISIDVWSAWIFSVGMVGNQMGAERWSWLRKALVSRLHRVTAGWRRLGSSLAIVCYHGCDSCFIALLHMWSFLCVVLRCFHCMAVSRALLYCCLCRSFLCWSVLFSGCVIVCVIVLLLSLCGKFAVFIVWQCLCDSVHEVLCVLFLCGTVLDLPACFISVSIDKGLMCSAFDLWCLACLC